jgi:hypothetical protein
MVLNTGTELRNVDVMNVRNSIEYPISNTGMIVKPKVGRYGGENG